MKSRESSTRGVAVRMHHRQQGRVGEITAEKWLAVSPLSLAVTRSCQRKCSVRETRVYTIPRFTITVRKVRWIVHDRVFDSHSAETMIDPCNRQSIAYQ